MSGRHNLVGRRFGRLVVVADSGERRNAHVVWRCRCDCGELSEVTTQGLTTGSTKSCGCFYREFHSQRMQHIEGRRFGRLVVLHQEGIRNNWCCECDCGALVTVRGNNLLQGVTQSCGCLMRERVVAASTTHGMTGTAEAGMLKAARDRAQMLGLPFTITLDDVHVPDVCPALGIPLTRGDGVKHDGSPTLDRLRPALGYVPGNVVVISDLANRIKQNCTSEQVRTVGNWMRAHGL